MPGHRPDLRTVLLAAFAWFGALAGSGHGTVLPVSGGVLVLLAAVGAAIGHRRVAAVLLAGLMVYAAVAVAAGVRYDRVTHNALTVLAGQRAGATLTGTTSDDPRLITGRFGDEVLVRVAVRQVRTPDVVVSMREPALIFGPRAWLAVPLGTRVQVWGHLAPSSDGDVAAIVSTSESPDIRAGPDPWWRASGAVRAGLRDSVAGLPADRRALVPALVDGDDAGLDPRLSDDFKTTGLTHLLAVSGTNLTLVVGFALLVARWLRVRGRWLYVVGVAGIVGFVLLARPEPSVLRAAAMGSVALLGMGANGADRGTRALGVATVVLLMVDPGLASTAGFGLSVLATAGILLLAPGWRDGLATWLPRWLAEAIAVPAAAQLACTPMVAAVSGQVSLVAVAANLLAAPAVGPATVLGLIGGLTDLLWPGLGRVVAVVAGWCVGWIVLVAERGAGLPGAALTWGSGVVALGVLTALCCGVAMVAPRVVGHRSTGLACSGLLVLAVLVRVPTPGWPPPGWLIVACDVGQGDGLVLNTGVPHSAVVVDAGPDPKPMAACLDGLGVRQVPLVVLTHFHADHVDGLAGVLEGRHVDSVWVSRLLDPPQGVDLVRAATQDAGVPTETAPYAQTRRIGDLTLEPIWPLPSSPTVGPGDGSTANSASVVLIARIRGISLFLGGDIEPEGQQRLAAAFPHLHVDVLKVPHHGSRYQDLPFLQSLGSRLAVISVGVDNDYGHPSAQTIAGLAATGQRVLRTDRDGAVAVVEHDGALSAVTTH